MSHNELKEAVVRGWCHPKNSSKKMDVDLAMAIIEEVWKADRSPNLGCATTRELFNELIARTDVDGRMDYRTIDSD